MFSLSCPVSHCLFPLLHNSEHRLMGHLHGFKVLLLGKGVILFLCTFCLTVGVRSWSGSPHTLAEDCYFYRVIFYLDPIPDLSRD